jgi:hypothetical protein
VGAFFVKQTAKGQNRSQNGQFVVVVVVVVVVVIVVAFFFSI